MSKKYYIALDDYERGTIINCLNEKRNKLIADGKYTEVMFCPKFISTAEMEAEVDAAVEALLDEIAKLGPITVKEALDEVRSGSNPTLTTRQKHTRECYVVAKEGADLDRIENEIKTMPNYFADYDTTVNFISEEEFNKNHQGIPHGGVVIRSGKTGPNLESNHIIEYKITLDSNPEFTASVIVAYARATYRLANEKCYGAKTVFDVPPAYLSPKSGEELRATLL